MQQKKWFLGKFSARLVLIGMLTFGLVACGSAEEGRAIEDTATGEVEEDTGVLALNIQNPGGIQV